MVARSERKMIEKLAEIKNTAVEKDYVVADFFAMKTIEEYESCIASKL